MLREETHWDHLLKEVEWLATDFQKERQRNIAKAKKLGKSIETFHKTIETRKLKTARDEVVKVRKVANKISLNVRKFWMKIDKIISFKQKGEFDEIRQKAMDKHLVHLVKQTERYTSMITENLRLGGHAESSRMVSNGRLPERSISESPVKSLLIKRSAEVAEVEIPREKRVRFETVERSDVSGTTVEDVDVDVRNVDDVCKEEEDDNSDEFVGEDEPDDETTMVEEENAEPIMTYEEEMALLEQDKEMSVEQIRAMFANIPDEIEDDNAEEEDDDEADDDEFGCNATVIRNQESQNISTETDINRIGITEEGAEESNDSDEFVGEDEPDDETTMVEEENAEPIMTYEEEMALLEQDKEMSVEQIRAMFANMPDEIEDNNDGENDDDDDDDEAEDDNVSVSSRSKDDKQLDSFIEKTENKENENGTEREGVVDDDDDDVGEALLRLEQADEAARSVHVDRPYVLIPSLSLREYQHAGLNWLVSLHDRRLNGILADEMGLGKTIQTIAVLAYLAAFRGVWGPHLVVVPTSCLINWESEFKKFCPIFKILTYYGSAKTRKNLRIGWSKLNSFHVCITSYQLVVQDSKAFRKKRWYYMILDEAHNIKNFKSQRWQVLLNFSTQRRLLLTGTPLQNNLMELWSLMHFLMPHIFRSRKEFSYWFNNPLASMVEGSRGINNNVISRLHSIMRPFILRRLKVDVAKQLPAKHEHIVMCNLSKRQLFLYEEFMSRSTTKSFLEGGNYMGMMNILMQLRKVCNHPDLFEPRPIMSPFLLESLEYRPGELVITAVNYDKLCSLSHNKLTFWDYDVDDFSRGEIDRLKVSENVLIDPSIIKPLHVPSQLDSPLFADYLGTKLVSYHNDELRRLKYNYDINTVRCSFPRLSLNWRLERAVTIDTFTSLVSKSKVKSHAARAVTSSWYALIKTLKDRVEELDEMISKFVFVLPKVNSTGIKLISSSPKFNDIVARSTVYNKVWKCLSDEFSIYYPARIRQQIFFPDRKLVQFDSGKLQTLCVLLRKLKAGGHKCLIFTQMSKMLDILEVFLNLHSHSYVRLDGSTGIDKRQKLMDRFNNDPKLFCFILSTRSGGLGINLTGADCVIFYDSDWNPAMDAQAQDRAHRIGQTREVNIYRLVCASTVEENILVKAKQKRHLDFLVMTAGSFSEESLFTSTGLKDLLGAASTGDDATNDSSETQPTSYSTVDVEAAMAAAEDAEDLSHMKGVKDEIALLDSDFDENAAISQDDDDADEASVEKAKGKSIESQEMVSEEKALELEFASWQATLGPDFSALEKALKQIERYAVSFHTIVDPYYSMYFISEQNRLEEISEEAEDSHWDVEEIEREKEEEEYRALTEGELLATEVSTEESEALKDWYVKERSKRERERKNRIITGAGWSLVIDDLTKCPYWYNDDNGDASYSKPKIVEDLENYNTALGRRYNACPHNVLIAIFEYLIPFPDRLRAGLSCARWQAAAHDHVFYKRVLSVESGAREMSEALEKNLRPLDFISLGSALATALPGDTIIMGFGHHWEQDIHIKVPVRILSERDDPSKCVVELVGRITIESVSVCLVGLTFRRPKKSSQKISLLKCVNSKLLAYACIFNNDGGNNTCLFFSKSTVSIFESIIQRGVFAGIVSVDSCLQIASSTISDNAGHGLFILSGEVAMEESFIGRNQRDGLHICSNVFLRLLSCKLKNNTGGSCSSDGSCFMLFDECEDDFQDQESSDMTDMRIVESILTVS